MPTPGPGRSERRPRRSGLSRWPWPGDVRAGGRRGPAKRYFVEVLGLFCFGFLGVLAFLSISYSSPLMVAGGQGSADPERRQSRHAPTERALVEPTSAWWW